jgi:SAM-dependent methyltransferase
VSHKTTRGRADSGLDREPVPWFRAAFGALYPVVYAHRDDSAAEHEARFAKELLDLEPGDRVLDLACGDGRHLSVFAKMGCIPFGVDLSTDLVSRARLRRRFAIVRADLRSLPFEDHAFDHATCFFTSFGYFDTEEENARVLEEAARVIRPGGRFLLDVPDREALERGLVPHDEFHREGLHVRCSRTIDRGRVRKTVSVTNGRGEEVAHFVESVRVYALDELRGRLHDARFRVIREAGGFDGATIGAGDRFILAAERLA